ncbi:MAG TPA: aldo/keto reductase, partial [Candidatus Krumholzibacteria bacterium]|nr:aldo/keto reductase [Candidatus Krumholzibacteria bacterium]
EREYPARDIRRFLPRFQPGNVDRNLELVNALVAVAGEKRATVAQIAIAWVLARGNDIVPLIGARTRKRLTEALGALDIQLTRDDLARIERAIPAGAAAGDRYDPHQMKVLDSERRLS